MGAKDENAATSSLKGEEMRPCLQNPNASRRPFPLRLRGPSSPRKRDVTTRAARGNVTRLATPPLRGGCFSFFPHLPGRRVCQTSRAGRRASADAVAHAFPSGGRRRGREGVLWICRTGSSRPPLRPQERVRSACPWCGGASSAGWCPSKAGGVCVCACVSPRHVGIYLVLP